MFGDLRTKYWTKIFPRSSTRTSWTKWKSVGVCLKICLESKILFRILLKKRFGAQQNSLWGNHSTEAAFHPPREEEQIKALSRVCVPSAILLFAKVHQISTGQLQRTAHNKAALKGVFFWPHHRHLTFNNNDDGWFSRERRKKKNAHMQQRKSPPPHLFSHPLRLLFEGSARLGPRTNCTRELRVSRSHCSLGGQKKHF